MYACKIKETKNGSRRCACRETWQAQGVIAQRRFARDVQVNEQSRAAQNGQDQAQGETDKEEAALKLAKGLANKQNAHSFCMVCITCFKGSVLILLAPVKGWSRT